MSSFQQASSRGGRGGSRGGRGGHSGNSGNFNNKDKKKSSDALQTGTGLHVDINAMNMWYKELPDHSLVPVDRFRVYQSYVACNDNAGKELAGKDGGMQVVPGFHKVCQDYWTKCDDPQHGRKLDIWGSSLTKFNFKNKHDLLIQKCVAAIQRIPNNWEQVLKSNATKNEYLNDDAKLHQRIKKGSLTIDEAIKYCQDTYAEHDKLDYVPVKSGDWIIWDNRTAHQNAAHNMSDHIRHVFYHGFLLAHQSTNGHLIKSIQQNRQACTHPADFPKKYAKIEANQATADKLPKLSALGKKLYGYEPWTSSSNNSNEQENNAKANVSGEQLLELAPKDVQEQIQKGKSLVTDRHIAYYKRYGYVVIENAVQAEVINALKASTSAFLKQHGVQLDLLQPTRKQPVTIEQWEKISSSFGGMLETFWLPEMDLLRQDPVLYGITVRMTEATWATNTQFYEHPFGKIDPQHLWLYVDRQNVRMPKSWSE